jgi:hypothetical protein
MNWLQHTREEWRKAGTGIQTNMAKRYWTPINEVGQRTATPKGFRNRDLSLTLRPRILIKHVSNVITTN